MKVETSNTKDLSKISKRVALSLLGLAALVMVGCGSLDSGGKRALSQDKLALRISEIQYHPLDEGSVDGDAFEFLEIQNIGNQGIDLTQVGFTDGVEYTFPDGASIPAHGYRVIASDSAAFKQRYGFSPDGVFKGHLNNAGERIRLSDLAANVDLISVTYSDGYNWPQDPDGKGPSLVPLFDPAQDSSLSGSTLTWRRSFSPLGSPGKVDAPVVVINEISTHTDPPAKDAIELYNPNAESMELGGWYLSDNGDYPKKFRIPDGLALSGHGYHVFTSDDFDVDSTSATSFNLSAHGESLFLFASEKGCAESYCEKVEFGEIENGVTFGRHVDGGGEAFFVAQEHSTLGEANSEPRLGSIALREVMYHPAQGAEEWVELQNISDIDVDLFDRHFAPHRPWKVAGTGFTFPESLTVKSKEIFLVVSDSMSIDEFRAAHNLDSAIKIFSSHFTLKDDADKITLLQPQEPYVDAGGDTVIPYKLVESLHYTSALPWPKTANGGGKSLQRKDMRAFSESALNWEAGDPTPGL